MNTYHNPTTIAAPLSAYSHGVVVASNAQWLYISGQVGMRPDGQLAEGIAAQTEQAWRNLIAILEDAGFGVGDIVRLNTYLTDPRYTADFRDIRDRFQGEHRPASTLIIVAGLASPEMLVEIEVVAAKAP